MRHASSLEAQQLDLTASTVLTIMTTIPARLARVTRVAHSPEQARAAVIQLYRDWRRGVRLSPVSFRCVVNPHHIGTGNYIHLHFERHCSLFPSMHTKEV